MTPNARSRQTRWETLIHVEADTIPGEAATGIAEMIRIRSAVTGRKEDDIARKILTAEEAFVNPHHQAPNRL
jgi:hypothetical protein